MTRDEESGREEERERDGTASDRDPDTSETGKTDDDHDDDIAEADEQSRESFPSSDPPAW